MTTPMHYLPGTDLLLVHQDKACLISSTYSIVGHSTLMRLWEALAGELGTAPDQPFEDLLDALLTNFGLRALPSFSLVTGRASTAVVTMRGELTVSARSGGGDGQPLVASSAMPWTTHVVDADVVTMGETAGQVLLPVTSGIVLASGVLWGAPAAPETAGPRSDPGDPGDPAAAGPMVPVAAHEPSTADGDDAVLEHPDPSGPVEPEEDHSGYTALFRRRGAAPGASGPPPGPSANDAVPPPVSPAAEVHPGHTQEWMGEADPPQERIPSDRAPSVPTPAPGPTAIIDGIPDFAITPATTMGGPRSPSPPSPAPTAVGAAPQGAPPIVADQPASNDPQPASGAATAPQGPEASGHSETETPETPTARPTSRLTTSRSRQPCLDLPGSPLDARGRRSLRRDAPKDTGARLTPPPAVSAAMTSRLRNRCGCPGPPWDGYGSPGVRCSMSIGEWSSGGHPRHRQMPPNDLT